MLENVPLKALFIRLSAGAVAPLAGAWIETLWLSFSSVA